MRSRLRAVLFDLDGTLIATRQLYAAALAPHLGRHLSEDEIMALRPAAETAFLPGLVPPAAAGPCLDAFYAHYAALHAEHFRGIYDGVPALLDGLRAQGLQLGLFTGKSRRAWDITGRHVELGGFETLVFGDEIDRQKPAPDGLARALDLLGLAAGEAIYIGDSASDLDAARAAGMAAGAVLWSKRDDERAPFRSLADGRGAKVFTTPDELAVWARAASAG